MPTKRTPTIVRVMALFAVVCLTLLGLVSTTSTTDASWSSSDSTQSAFGSGQVGQVQNLQCIDSEDGVLGTGLLAEQVQLVWEAPAGLENNPNVTYEVTWVTVVLGIPSSIQRSVVLDSLSYTHTATGSLLSLGIDFTVRARVGQWVSESIGQIGVQSVGIVGVNAHMGC